MSEPSLAGPGEVFVGSTTRDLLDGSGVVLEEAGPCELKVCPVAARSSVS